MTKSKKKKNIIRTNHNSHRPTPEQTNISPTEFHPRSESEMDPSYIKEVEPRDTGHNDPIERQGRGKSEPRIPNTTPPTRAIPTEPANPNSTQVI